MKEQETKAAIALQYDGEGAPIVTASGKGLDAEDIIRIAKNAKIPLFEHPDLASVLAELNLGEEIPEHIFQIVAEVLAFAFFLQGKVPKGFNDKKQL